MLPQMVRDKEGFLIGYAVTSRMSYDDVDRFVRVVRNHEPHTVLSELLDHLLHTS